MSSKTAKFNWHNIPSIESKGPATKCNRIETQFGVSPDGEQYSCRIAILTHDGHGTWKSNFSFSHPGAIRKYAEELLLMAEELEGIMYPLMRSFGIKSVPTEPDAAVDA